MTNSHERRDSTQANNAWSVHSSVTSQC